MVVLLPLLMKMNIEQLRHVIGWQQLLLGTWLMAFWLVIYMKPYYQIRVLANGLSMAYQMMNPYLNWEIRLMKPLKQ